MGIAGSWKFQEGKQYNEKVQNPKGTTVSLVRSHWVRANSWVICVLPLTLLVKGDNNHPAEGGAESDPPPLTGHCLARKASSDTSLWW